MKKNTKPGKDKAASAISAYISVDLPRSEMLRCVPEETSGRGGEEMHVFRNPAACSQMFNPGGFDRSLLACKFLGTGRPGNGAASAEPGWGSWPRSAYCLAARPLLPRLLQPPRRLLCPGPTAPGPTRLGARRLREAAAACERNSEHFAIRGIEAAPWPARRHACREAVRTAYSTLVSQLAGAYPECWYALTTTQTLVGGCATGLRLRLSFAEKHGTRQIVAR